MDLSSKYVPRGGVDEPALAYSDTGEESAPPVLLLHSLGADRRMWTDLQEELSTAHRVIAPDTRGHGRSEWAATPTVDEWVADITRLLDHLGVDRVGLVGLSMGGVQALAFALKHPDRVRALVLADTFAQLEPDLAAAKTKAMIDGSQALGMAAYADSYVAETFTTTPLPPEAELVRESLAKMSQHAYADAVRTCFGVRLADRLGEVRAPTVVLWGERDQKTPRPLAEQLVAGIPDTVLRVIPAAGHLANLENPAAFAAAVTEHLNAEEHR
jgi:3-oxoadipate enol-lactonase